MLTVSRTVSPRDEMWDGPWYFEVGHEAMEFCREAGNPQRILDLPCGHGRVLRWLRAEWPEAEITACDLNRDGVDFCASEFGAVPLYSEVEPERVPLSGSYDLIWVGSLFTHLDAPLWPRFLRKLASHLNGLLVFTTAGPTVAEQMRQGEMADVVGGDLLRSYDETGFGYADYHGQDYGLARAKPEWVTELLASLPLELVEYREAGWADRQDVYFAKSSSA